MFVSPADERYDGEWHQNLRAGHGTCTYPLGQVYEGARLSTTHLRRCPRGTPPPLRHHQVSMPLRLTSQLWHQNLCADDGMCIYPLGQVYEGARHSITCLPITTATP